MSAASDARIHDRGYRRFDGTRTGPSGAIRTTYRHTVERILGLRRGGRAKTLPFIVIGLAYAPAIVFIGIGVLLPDRLSRASFPGYANYYGFILSAILLFCAFVAPEALCPDRRNRLLGVYLTSPLTRRTYLLAKLGAVTSCIAAVTLLPVLLVAVAKSLQGTGPSTGDLAVLIGRIIASGVLLAVFYAVITLAVSALTDRKGFASAGYVLLFIVTSSITAAIRNRGRQGALFSRAGDWSVVFDLANLPLETVKRIYGERGAFPGASTALLIVALAVWIAAAIVLLFGRYERLEVTR